MPIFKTDVHVECFTIECELNYSPGSPGSMYRPNGDPGDPPDPEEYYVDSAFIKEVNGKSVERIDIIETLQDLDETEGDPRSMEIKSAFIADASGCGAADEDFVAFFETLKGIETLDDLALEAAGSQIEAYYYVPVNKCEYSTCDKDATHFDDSLNAHVCDENHDYGNESGYCSTYCRLGYGCDGSC